MKLWRPFSYGLNHRRNWFLSRGFIDRMGDVLMIAIRHENAEDTLRAALDTPGARAGFAVYQLCETVKELEALDKDPLAFRHVRASREELRRMAIRLHHLLG